MEKPELKIYPRTKEYYGGREGEGPGVDSNRPDVIPYPQSIAAFRDSLKKGVQVDENQALKQANEKYTEERLIGRNGRGERP